MTAVVGVLNKHAIAIAADSAVTIDSSNGKKIFNAANKIFTLSKFHPVGIMIYNAANFMGIPWETIIKIYRKQLGEKSFNTISEHKIDFINFLNKKNYFDEESLGIKSFIKFCETVIKNNVIAELAEENEAIINKLPQGLNEEEKENFIKKIDQKSIELEKSIEGEICPEFEKYTFENFLSELGKIVDDTIKYDFAPLSLTLPKEVRLNIKKLTFKALKTKLDITGFSGLIFTGFGDNEIYPAVETINVSFAINGKLRYYNDQNGASKVNSENKASILPFAQTDVINTILTGIDPSFNRAIIQNFIKYFDKYNKFIVDQIGTKDPELLKKIESIDDNEIIQDLTKTLTKYQSLNHINPLIHAVATLSKEDLAEMAESLIYLTYLKRRITFAEESVGGPVDVAIISKGDGFIWIKRKHYFDPNFQKNYFNK